MSEITAHYNVNFKKKENQISPEKLIHSLGELLYCVIKSREFVHETMKKIGIDEINEIYDKINEDMETLIKEALSDFYGAVF